MERRISWGASGLSLLEWRGVAFGRRVRSYLPIGTQVTRPVGGVACWQRVPVRRARVASTVTGAPKISMYLLLCNPV